LKKSIASLTDKLEPATSKFKDFFKDFKNDPSGTIKTFLLKVKGKFNELIKWWKTKGPMTVIQRFFDNLKKGFFSILYTFAGFFSYVKTRGFGNVLKDIASGKVGTQVALSTAKIATGNKVNLDEIAKMESDRALTTKEIGQVKSQLSKEEQKQFEKGLASARKDYKVTPEEILQIIKDIGIMQRIQQDKIGSLEENQFSTPIVASFD
jgi:hypothetical protein